MITLTSARAGELNLIKAISPAHLRDPIGLWCLLTR
jgi:hypothetical protein